MAGEGDAKVRFPRQEVGTGQKHGYLGDVEVIDAPVAGASNASAADTAATRQAGKGAKNAAGGTIGIVTPADAGEETA